MAAEPGLLRALLAMAAGLALSGCQLMAKPWPPWSDTDLGRSGSVPAADPTLDPLAAYVELTGALAHGDAAARHAVYQRVAQAHAAAPTPQTALHLAAVVGNAGHADADAARAERLLTEIEAARDVPAVVAQLARQLRAQLRLAGLARPDCEDAQREQRRLRLQLEEAERKIKALSAIERKLEAPAPRPPASR